VLTLKFATENTQAPRHPAATRLPIQDVLTLTEMSCLSRISNYSASLLGGVVGQGSVDRLTWNKRCDSGACVEVAVRDEAVFVRSSANPEAITTFTRAEWQDFLSSAKEGLFDDF